MSKRVIKKFTKFLNEQEQPAPLPSPIQAEMKRVDDEIVQIDLKIAEIHDRESKNQLTSWDSLRQQATELQRKATAMIKKAELDQKIKSTNV